MEIVDTILGSLRLPTLTHTPMGGPDFTRSLYLLPRQYLIL